jgi:hypothetical protein
MASDLSRLDLLVNPTVVAVADLVLIPVKLSPHGLRAVRLDVMFAG